ncbi:hypothetical protein IG631_04986 [Alternaria alternata]|nr:hypothetical protein IG631_04986 [Alternaria alternata]
MPRRSTSEPPNISAVRQGNFGEPAARKKWNQGSVAGNPLHAVSSSPERAHRHRNRSYSSPSLGIAVQYGLTYQPQNLRPSACSLQRPRNPSLISFKARTRFHQRVSHQVAYFPRCGHRPANLHLARLTIACRPSLQRASKSATRISVVELGLETALRRSHRCSDYL